jgi:hypothetical protein
MSVVARTFVSIPVRSARETWNAICNLVAPESNSTVARELCSVAGVAASLISREAMTAPMVIYGSGPRLRVYCLYNADAIEGDGSNESALAFDATEGDWQMSLPCPADDITWVQAELAQRSRRISARDQNSKVGEDETETDSAQSFVLKLDEEAFFRP